VQTAINNEALGTVSSGKTVPSSAQEMLQNMPLQRLKGSNHTTGLSSDRLISRPRELNITFKPQRKDNRAENLTTNYGKQTVKRKWTKENIIKYSIWTIRGIAYKQTELDNVLNEKQIEIAGITE
jgi:hypothetical protein